VTRPGDDERDEDVDVILRPDVVELGDEAVIPDHNLIRPPPNRFTHRVIVDEPYWFDRPHHGDEPDGVFAAGTPVLLLVAGDDRSRVADAGGLYVQVSTASLGPAGD
jgi:hypothetical protein